MGQGGGRAVRQPKTYPTACRQPEAGNHGDEVGRHANWLEAELQEVPVV